MPAPLRSVMQELQGYRGNDQMSAKLAAANAALQQGNKVEAANLMIEALVDGLAAPGHIYPTLLNLLLQLGRNDDGVLWSERALQLAPKDYILLNLYGAFLRLTGRRAEAVDVFDRAIKLKPGEIAARVNKGHIYNDLGNGAAAEQIFTGLVRQHPRIPELQRALGVALMNQGKLELAERRFRQCLKLDPANIDAWLDLSATQRRRGDLDTALYTLDEAMRHNRATAHLPRAKAVMLRNAGKRDRAAQYLRSLSARFREFGWFHHELGRNIAQSAPAEAALSHRCAIELEPRNTNFRLALAEHQLRQSTPAPGTNVADAYATLSACPPMAPNANPSEKRIRAQILARALDWPGLRALGSFASLGREWAEANIHSALFDHLARVETAEDRRALIDQHRIWGDRAIARAESQPIRRPGARQSSGKIRLGFLSSDLREHSVTYFAWPLFEYRDRARFEIYCYSFFRASEPSPLQRRLTQMVDVFRWDPEISDRDAAQMIANDDLDMLIELGGSSHMNKLEVMAWKPAKLCASWLGYPHSAGPTTIDYLIVDPFLAPPDPDLLIEKPLMMPRSWITMSGQAFPESYRINPVCPYHRNGFVTFGTANNPYKYNPDMLHTWAQILARVPNSRLVFVRPEVGAEIVANNIRAIFEAEGVSGDRIELRPVEGGHIPHYNDIDIALDTFPQTGGTTTCEALWMGVPTITLVGEALFERLSYSILQNAGLSYLCATTRDQFVDIAVELASDGKRLQAFRTGLREQLRASPLGQSEQFAKDFYALIARTVANGD